MEANFPDWASLLLRWAHVINAVALTGSSFHFVSLDTSLTPPLVDKNRAKGVGGGSWVVGRARRLFLPPAKVAGVAVNLARQRALIDVAKLLHLAHRLCLVHRDLTLQRVNVFDQQVALQLVVHGGGWHGALLKVEVEVEVVRHMPMNNASQITEPERAVLVRWFLAVAKSGAQRSGLTGAWPQQHHQRTVPAF